MKKILFLVTQSEMGGTQRYVYEISKVLSKRHEILVAAGKPAFAKATAGKSDGELFRKLKDTRVKPVYLKQIRRTPWPWQVVLAVAEIVSLLRKERPDVLFLCSTTAGLLGSIASFFYKNNGDRISIIYRIGGWAFSDPRPFWQNWLILLAEKITAPLKDKIIVNSELGRNVALKYKIAPSSKIVKIYNGLETNSLNFLPKAEARQIVSQIVRHPMSNVRHRMSNNPWIGCVANFYKTKGLEYLIEAARLLNPKSKIQNPKFIIIGEGRLRPKLEALIKKYGLENKVILAGRIPDAYKYLKAFDVFVLPSLKEGFPWIILEAMAAGVPIVATKVGALPEILPEEFLVEPADTEALAKKISWLLEQPAVPKPKQEFSLQRMVEETEKLL